MNSVIKITKNFAYYVNFRTQVKCQIKTVAHNQVNSTEWLNIS